MYIYIRLHLKDFCAVVLMSSTPTYLFKNTDREMALASEVTQHLNEYYFGMFPFIFCLFTKGCCKLASSIQ